MGARSAWAAVCVVGALVACAYAWVPLDLHATDIHYDMQILRHPQGPADGSNSNTNSEYVDIKSVHGQTFRCLLPVSPAHPTPEHNTHTKQQHLDVEWITQHLNGTCLYSRNGWWTYKLCIGGNITQFHVPDERKMDHRSPEDAILLGRFEAPNPLEVNANKETSVRYINGTICDLTGKARQANVLFQCKRGAALAISSILEPSTCNYEIVLISDQFCPEKERKEVFPKISCFPVDVDGNPITLREEEEQGIASEADSVPDISSPYASGVDPSLEFFQAGDFWDGIYTCQGEQRFDITITDVKKNSDGAEVSAHLAFYHHDGKGSYFVRGQYFSASHRLKLHFDVWDLKPRGFISIDLDGSLSDDGDKFYGIIPECDYGPFLLEVKGKRDPPPRKEAALEGEKSKHTGTKEEDEEDSSIFSMKLGDMKVKVISLDDPDLAESLRDLFGSAASSSSTKKSSPEASDDEDETSGRAAAKKRVAGSTEKSPEETPSKKTKLSQSRKNAVKSSEEKEEEEEDRSAMFQALLKNLASDLDLSEDDMAELAEIGDEVLAAADGDGDGDGDEAGPGFRIKFLTKDDLKNMGSMSVEDILAKVLASKDEADGGTEDAQPLKRKSDDKTLQKDTPKQGEKSSPKKATTSSSRSTSSSTSSSRSTSSSTSSAPKTDKTKPSKVSTSEEYQRLFEKQMSSMMETFADRLKTAQLESERQRERALEETVKTRKMEDNFNFVANSESGKKSHRSKKAAHSP